MKHSLKLIGGIMALGMLFMNFEGCSNEDKVKAAEDTITIMAPLNGIVQPKDDDEIVKRIEDITGEKVKFIWLEKQVYKEKSLMMMSSGEYPDILVVPDETLDIVDGVNKGGFFEITDYINDYDNLRDCNKDILKNSSYNGKIYGVYRYSDPIKNVLILRKDWLSELGISSVQSPEDLKSILQKFKEKGKEGLEMAGDSNDEFSGFLKEIGTWFGAPNNWVESDDNLKPYFLTSEFKNSLSYMKDLYDEDLLDKKLYLKNDDDVLNDLKKGICGAAMIKTSDALKLAKEDEKNNEMFTVLGGVYEKDKGKKLFDKGYSGMLMFPKKGIKNEAKLKRVLRFLDKLNSPEAYEMFNSKVSGEKADKLLSYSEINMNLKEECSYKNDEGSISKDVLKIHDISTEKKSEDKEADLKIEGSIQDTSGVYEKIDEINANYIFGNLDSESYDDEINNWLENGGQKYSDKVNELYEKSK